MNRIFPVLALFTFLVLGVTMVLGLNIGDLRVLPNDAAMQTKRMHFLMGVTAALAVVLVESIVATYFIGTSRWCREVSETYGLSADYIVRGNRIKRRAFPHAVAGMLVAVAMASLGAAADPSANVQTKLPLGLEWSQAHLAGSFLGTAFIGLSFYMLWLHIDQHRHLIAEILEEVRKIRVSKNLPV
ncbi:MAG: hypothetical protein AB7O62_23965 [Pirellulales bacterium]